MHVVMLFWFSATETIYFCSIAMNSTAFVLPALRRESPWPAPPIKVVQSEPSSVVALPALAAPHASSFTTSRSEPTHSSQLLPAEMRSTFALSQTLRKLEREEKLAFDGKLSNRVIYNEGVARDEISCLEEQGWRDIGEARWRFLEETCDRMKSEERTKRVAVEDDERHHWILCTETHTMEAQEAVLRQGILTERDKDILLLSIEERVDASKRLKSAQGFTPASVIDHDDAWSSNAGPSAVTSVMSSKREAPLLCQHRVENDPLGELRAVVEDVAAMRGEALATKEAHEAVEATVHAVELQRRIVSTTFTRERVMLEDGSDLLLPPTIPNSHPLPSLMSGIVLPWEFVINERKERLLVTHEEERLRLLQEADLELHIHCVHVEDEVRRRLVSVYRWADEDRLVQVLLLQRWWRCLQLQSTVLRRRLSIRNALPAAAKQNRLEETVEVLHQRLENMEDATLRDVWAEDYETGELGLYFPFRRQLLDIAAERTAKHVYNTFLQSLRSHVERFIRKRHIDVAFKMHQLFFYDEVDGRENVMVEEARVMAATMKMHRRLLDGGQHYPNSAAVELLVDTDRVVGHPLTQEPFRSLYTQSRGSELKRVEYCRRSWQQYRVDDGLFIREHQDYERYAQVTATRLSSAGSNRRPQAASDRIPSAGYQRVGSAGYRRLNSAGYERLGSAGYQRLGSAGAGKAKHPSGPRLSSASLHSSRLRSAGRQKVYTQHVSRAPLRKYWEGSEYVRAAKVSAANEESAARRDILSLYERHVLFASVFQAMLNNNYRDSVLGGFNGTFEQEASDVIILEDSGRSIIDDDERLARWHLLLAASASCASASLRQTPHPQTIVDAETAHRSDVSREERLARVAFEATMQSLLAILSDGTEHLKRTGMIPRAPGERRNIQSAGSTHRRLSSALQRDDLASRRRNYASIAAVAVIIQRWWRLRHFKVYRMPEAAKDVLMLQRLNSASQRSKESAASVVQQQLRDMSYDQLIRRRTLSSAGCNRSSSLPTLPAGRPQSASSNLLLHAGVESFRTIVSHQMTQHSYLSWTSLEEEERTARQEWALIERIQRQGLERSFHETVAAPMWESKSFRIVKKQEPTNRLRIEREALYAFVGLFFSEPAQLLRCGAVLDGESSARHRLAEEEVMYWTRIRIDCEAERDIVSMMALMDFRTSTSQSSTPGSIVCRPNESITEVLEADRFQAKMAAFSAQIRRLNAKKSKLRGCGKIEGGEVTKRSPVVMDPERLAIREDIHRTTCSRDEVEGRQCLVAHHFVEWHATIAAELFAEWSRTRALQCREFDLVAPRRPVPIAQLQYLFVEEKEARLALAESWMADKYAAILADAHERLLEKLWARELATRRHMLVSECYATHRDVATALVQRLVRLDTKPLELAALEQHARNMLCLSESFQRNTANLDISVGHAMWEQRWSTW